MRKAFAGWTPRALPGLRFPDLLRGRRSDRSLARPALGDVLDMVAAATLARFAADGDRFGRTRRASASAGALHPVSVVIVRPCPTPLPFHVDPASGNLRVLRVADAHGMRSQAERLRTMLPGGQPTHLVFLGDLELVAAAYENPASLLWRDAGTLLATLHLCAASLGLGFCPLGALGEGFADAIFPGRARLVACGTAAVGVPAGCSARA